MAAGNILSVALDNEETLNAFGAHFSRLLNAGDIVAFEGDLGVGKTTFVKSVLRSCFQDPALDVPSPTFSIVQHYEHETQTYIHADLYRLNGAQDVDDIGLFEGDEKAIVFLEWPERLSANTNISYTYKVHLHYGESEQERTLTLEANHLAYKRAQRLFERFDFLRRYGFHTYPSAPMSGDASSRVYTKILLPEKVLILMDSPKRPDGPILAKGKPYSALAKLAEDVTPFVGVDLILRQLGFCAPKLEAFDLDRGFVLLEDLGDESVLLHGVPNFEKYKASVEMLALLHTHKAPFEANIDATHTYSVPAWDEDVLLTEVNLFLEWYWPYTHRHKITARVRESFTRAWQEALSFVVNNPSHLVLRDFHSPNIIWQNHALDEARVGLIDFQDALVGHGAYDVASIAQDARVDISQEFELKLVSAYVQKMRTLDESFSAVEFARAYSVLCAQRATKILGIFVRLSQRDGKHGYLKHLKRMQGYLRRALCHESAHELRVWFTEHADFEV